MTATLANRDAQPPVLATTVESFLPPAERVSAALSRQMLPPAQIESVLWLLEFGRKHGHHSRQKIGALIGRHSSVMSKVFSGSYPAIPKIIEAIEAFRRGGTKLLMADGWPLVELRITREIGTFLDLDRKARTMALLWGPNQSGKTKAFEAYTATERGERTFYVRMPAGGGTRSFLIALAKACGIPHRKSFEELTERFLTFFVPGDLVIIDEMHQAIIGRSLKIATIERIREIYDLCQIGMVLCGTDAFFDTMNEERFRGFLGQINNRAGALRKRIAAEPYRGDIARLASAYGYPPIEPGPARDELEKLMPHGLGRIAKLLQMAIYLAQGEKSEPTWEHFTRTVAAGRRWEKGEKGDKDSWVLEEGK